MPIRLSVKFARILIFAGTLIFVPPGFSAPEDYAVNVHYEEAVPAFLDALGDSVKDVENKEEIAQWADASSARAPEFLDDLIMAMRSVEEQEFWQADISKFEELSEKWGPLVEEYPALEKVEPLVTPLIEDLTRDLPRLRQSRPSDHPFQNFLEYFQEMEAFNPWGLAALFQIPWLQDEVRQMDVSQQSREDVREGQRKIYVVRRSLVKRVNGAVVFNELIENDDVRVVAFEVKDVLMIRDALQKMIQYGEDPDIIDAVSDLVALVEFELQQAWENGTIDDFTYAFIFNQEPIRNEMVHVLHPLMKNSYNRVYKTADFYPRGFMNFDDSGNETAASESFIEQLDIPPAETDAALPAATAGVPEGAARLFQGWLSGVVVPFYLFVVFGFFKEFVFH